MNAPLRDPDTPARMRRVLARQRAAFAAEGPPTERVRRDRLERAIAALVDARRIWCEALAEDFSCRNTAESLLVDVLLPLESLRHARRRLKRMMRPERRASSFPFNLLGARSEIRWSPKGVVGNVVPWNIPVLGLFGPLAPMLAAGNRVLIKMSESAPACAALAQYLLGRAFDETEVAVFTGDAAAGAAFAALPLDHLMFTGSSRVGRMVMHAAADNLTPVTLELGGKSPAVLCPDADLDLAARRIAWGKLVIGGQACIAPDYVLLPEARLEVFVQKLRAELLRQFPNPLSTDGPTAIINDTQLARLQRYIDDARARGARIEPVRAASEEGTATVRRRIAPTLIIDPPPECLVMREEIFGPLLPIKPYRALPAAVDFINARPHPLALYCFGGRVSTHYVVSHTTSGGVAVNDVINHGMQENLPFGGIGESGMGAFHAEFGFRAFSHARAVYRGSRIDPLAPLKPPFGPRTLRLLDRLLRLRRI
jgi:coniferyl-aldehyde dehydrogenase